jgi:hypothetical protein
MPPNFNKEKTFAGKEAEFNSKTDQGNFPN